MVKLDIENVGFAGNDGILKVSPSLVWQTVFHQLRNAFIIFNKGIS